jgi:hypothetical protein
MERHGMGDEMETKVTGRLLSSSSRTVKDCRSQSDVSSDCLKLDEVRSSGAIP